MKRVGLLGIVLAFVTTAFAVATPAFAATQNLSGTVTTAINQTAGGTFTDDVATNGANVTGAVNSNYLTMFHTSGNLLATWTVSATIGGLTDIGATFTFYKDAASNMGVSNMAQIVLTDSNGYTATLSTNLSMSSGTGPYTISTVFSAYTLSNVSFSFANVNAVAFTFAVGATGSKQFGLDAVDVVDTPEPATIALFGLGLAGLGGGLLRRRRARRAASSRPTA